MATKLKQFTVTRRFAVWADATIRAENIEDALEKGKALNYTDFIETPGGVELVDAEPLPGFGVREEW